MKKSPRTYYNEIDSGKAAWLRELIRRNVIAPGDVDERDIRNVKADDLAGYSQHHFFAGIGVWSYALRLAGWPDDRPVWTGSCPCPSFSAAGKGAGFDDPRHLWPDWIRLIRECRPPAIFGEQVAAAIGHGWLDLVQTDLEAAAYSVGKAVLGACSVGAPHIRQRLYFCANSKESERRSAGTTRHDGRRSAQVGGSSVVGNSAESMHGERRPLDFDRVDGCDGQNARRQETYGESGACGEVLSSGDTQEQGFSMCRSASGNSGYPARAGEPLSGQDAHGLFPEQPKRQGTESTEEISAGTYGESARRGHSLRPWRGPGWLDPVTARSVAETGATRGFWSDCDWWYGRDGRYRPAGPGIQPLAHGASARVLRLRGYGDAINAEVAKAFIASAMEAEP